MVWPFKTFEQKWKQEVELFCKPEIIEAPIKIEFRMDRGELASHIIFTSEQRNLIKLIGLDIINILHGHTLDEWMYGYFVRTGGTPEQIKERVRDVRDQMRGFHENVMSDL